MKKFKLVLLGIAAVLTLAGTAVLTSRVTAKNEFTAEICEDSSYTAEQKSAAGCKEDRTAGGVANGVINVVISIVGILAVGMLIYGGAKYVISAGRPDKMTQAKNIIAYSVVGLVVVLLAFAIVNFVIGEI